jgi:RNA polymerase sigma-70 factor (ECF subfamily)
MTPANEQVVMPRDYELLASLDRAVADLDDDKRAVFVLHEIEELAMAEVAAAVGCPLQTAYARLYAARKLLAAALEEVHT